MSIDSATYYQRRWDLWKMAKDFPKFVAECDYTLQFTLGRDDFGFEYGNYKRVYSGPKLNLTGATIQLHIEKLNRSPGLVSASRGETWTPGYVLCDLGGTITDAAEGEVSFEMEDTDCADIGWALGEIEVTDSSDKIIVPGHIRFFFVEKLR